MSGSTLPAVVLAERGPSPLLVADGPARPVVAREHVRRSWWVRRLLTASDSAAFGLGLVVACATSGHLRLVADLPWLILCVPVWVTLCWLYRLYDRDGRKVSHSTIDDLPALFHAVIVWSLVLWFLSRLLPSRDVVFSELVTIAAVTFLTAFVGRAAVRMLAARRLPAERVLLVGGGGTARALVDRMRTHPQCQLEPIGVLAQSDADGGELGLPVLGTLGDGDFGALASQHRVDRVVVSEDLNDERLLGLLHSCRQGQVKVDVMPAFFGALGPSVEVDDIGGFTMLAVHPPVLSRSDRAAKRTMDIAGSAILLFMAVPVLAALALLVKLTSRGPVFFRQERVGKGDHRFRLVKFRSMVVDAEAQRAALLLESKDQGWLHLERDPRITPFGAFLRKTSLDELPQLWNVLRGDMSLVGPRPLIVEEDSNVGGRHRSRLDLTPGMTGLWQVLGRTSIPFDEMVKLDYLYVTNWSLWGDVRLVLRTLPAVLGQRGSN